MKPINTHHKEILDLIKSLSDSPTQHTFSDSYLGNSHPRYPINAPTLRAIAKEWIKDHRHLSAGEIEKMLTSLIEGVSSTEKVMAGILLDASAKPQRKFNPKIFDSWLNHLEGWAEIDSVCTGQYTITEIPANFTTWKKILIKLSKSKNINKRRASLALLCSPVRRVYDPQMAIVGFQIIKQLESEDSILITKAISWLLRSMVKLYKSDVQKFISKNQNTLPKIALRETRTVLLTGKKTKSAV